MPDTGAEAQRREEIREYYDQCHTDYQLLWGTNRHHGIHMGYHDGDRDSHDAAIERMSDVLAAAADIDSDDRVLDAGCGVGGSAVMLARERGATVLGVNINSEQLGRARAYADVHHVADRVMFTTGDFTALPVADDAVDVVWGLEAICHADRKRAFLEEAARVLRPGGRIVVSDGFMRVRDDDLSPRDRRELAHWLDSWAVPNLAHIDDFRADLHELGFTVEARDLTANVYPSSVRLFLASIPLYVIATVLERVGVRTGVQTANVIGAYYQFLTLQKDLWGYWHVIAER